MCLDLNARSYDLITLLLMIASQCGMRPGYIKSTDLSAYSGIVSVLLKLPACHPEQQAFRRFPLCHERINRLVLVFSVVCDSKKRIR